MTVGLGRGSGRCSLASQVRPHFESRGWPQLCRVAHRCGPRRRVRMHTACVMAPASGHTARLNGGPPPPPRPPPPQARTAIIATAARPSRHHPRITTRSAAPWRYKSGLVRRGTDALATRSHAHTGGHGERERERCVCVRARARAYVRACVCVCARTHTHTSVVRITRAQSYPQPPFAPLVCRRTSPARRQTGVAHHS